jgi:CDP-2,3-bis-(O-geranylgeranyl)-sn-glycerol synthase
MGLLTLVTVLYLYLPGYLANTAAMIGGKWLPSLTGLPVKPIDGGRLHSDGNRLLGDGKTWNGLVTAVFIAGLVGIFTHMMATGSEPWLDPIAGGSSVQAFTVGATLGLGCMLGDAAGSYVKRRRGLKREGDTSSEAPLLDTLPFAMFTFATGLILFSDLPVGDIELLPWMAATLLVTPIIHRVFNILGYKAGLKDVPY